MSLFYFLEIFQGYANAEDALEHVRHQLACKRFDEHEVIVAHKEHELNEMLNAVLKFLLLDIIWDLCKNVAKEAYIFRGVCVKGLLSINITDEWLYFVE